MRDDRPPCTYQAWSTREQRLHPCRNRTRYGAIRAGSGHWLGVCGVHAWTLASLPEYEQVEWEALSEDARRAIRDHASTTRGGAS